MLGIQKISMNYINHPFAKYMLMLIREDPTLDEAAEREGCAPHFGLNSSGCVCSAHGIAVVLGWLKLSRCVLRGAFGGCRVGLRECVSPPASCSCLSLLPVCQATLSF